MTNLLLSLGGGLWIIPLLAFVGAFIFGRQAYIAHNSNSTQSTEDGILDNTGNVPYIQIGQFWYALVLAAFAVGFLIFA